MQLVCIRHAALHRSVAILNHTLGQAHESLETGLTLPQSRSCATARDTVFFCCSAISLVQLQICSSFLSAVLAPRPLIEVERHSLLLYSKQNGARHSHNPVSDPRLTHTTLN